MIPLQPAFLNTKLSSLALLAIGSITTACFNFAAQAQSYTARDLTPTAGNAAATGIVDGVAAGYTSAGIFGTAYRAQFWTLDGVVDLHPAIMDDPASGLGGRSYIARMGGSLQVGWGANAVLTSNRSVPLAWSGTAASAVALSIPFPNGGGQATSTDGLQIGGYAIGLNRDGTALDTMHALVWNAATGAAVDLGDGGSGAIVYGVGGGTQVGYVIKSLANAAMWRGDSRTLVVLHPRNAVLSMAQSTDGSRQVGYAGFDVRVRVEATKGNKEQRFNYAHVWNGTSASAANIHPYPVNLAAGVNLTQSYAFGVNASWIVGYAFDAAKNGTPASNHAIVWDSSLQSVDLNAFLPPGFVGSQALAVDADGNVSGFMSKADGTRHAVIWTLNPAGQGL